MDWNTIPAELLWNQIFPRLAIDDLLKVSQVCKKWRHACWSHNKELDFFSLSSKISGNGIQQICTKLLSPNQLETLIMPKCSITGDQLIDILKSNSKSLRFLDLQSCSKCDLINFHQRPDLLAWITENNYPYAAEIKTNLASKPNHRVWLPWTLVNLNLQLRSINVAGCSSVHDDSLPLFPRLKTLEYLCIERCTKVSDKGLNDFAAACSKLKELPPEEETPKKKKDKKKKNKEKELAPPIREVVEANIALRGIRLKGVYKLSPASILTLVQHNPAIEELDLDALKKLDDKYIHQIVQTATNLQLLDVRGCSLITNVGMKSIATFCNTTIRTLIIKFLPVDDEGIASICSECHLIEYFDIQGLQNITGRALGYIANGLPRLKTLDIRDCQTLQTDNDIGDVFQSCPNLSDLRMRNCLSTDKSLLEIAKYGQNLRLLDVQQCTRVTLRGLEAVCKSCPKLEHLNCLDVLPKDGLEDAIKLIHSWKFIRKVLASAQ